MQINCFQLQTPSQRPGGPESDFLLAKMLKFQKDLKNTELYQINSKIPIYDTVKRSDFQIYYYIYEKYKKTCSAYISEDIYTSEIYDYLLKNGKLINYHIYGKSKNVKNQNLGFSSGSSFWFYYKNDNYVKITLNTIRNSNDENNVLFDNIALPITGLRNELNTEDASDYSFELSIYAPSDKIIFIDDFKNFILENEKSKIFLFLRDSYGDYSFEELKIKAPDNMNLESNYNDDFIEVDKMIEKRLNEKKTGIYMFHGPSGTGKSYYIKHLTNRINRDFIYVPNNIFDSFVSDPMCLKLLIGKNNSIIILEDSEKIIEKRKSLDGCQKNSVSSLLNMSDGILGDILNISIIITYNCETEQIDDALLRKGRLQINYKFNLLNIEKSKKLSEKLGYSSDIINNIKADMSLSDIYNMDVTNSFVKKDEKEKIGF